MIEFVVQGDPVSQGSMTAFPFLVHCPECKKKGKPCGRKRVCYMLVGEPLGRVLRVNVTHESSEELDTWRSMIALEAKLAYNRAGMMVRPVFPAGTGVVVGCVFFIKRPKSHQTSKGELSLDGHRHPVPASKPDADKLLRGCIDAMSGATGGEVYQDDSQVLSPWPWKTWAPIGARTGHTVIVIERAEPSDIAAVEKVSARLVEIVRASRPSTGELFG